MTNYKHVLELIQLSIDEIEAELKSNSNADLTKKIDQFRKAKKWLIIGQELNINSDSKFHKLPTTITKTPSSEYRLIEDHESDDRTNWTEVIIEGKQIRPSEGDYIITS